MPIFTYGCLNVNCRHEFDSTVAPTEIPMLLAGVEKKVARGPECEVCRALTKWIPGATQIMRPMAEGKKSTLATANEILGKLYENYNAKVPTPGLQVPTGKGNRAGEPLIRPPLAPAMPIRQWSFTDGKGQPWQVPLPVDNSGHVVNGTYAPVPVDGVKAKTKITMDGNRSGGLKSNLMTGTRPFMPRPK